jgi:hypothetical protein
MDETKKAETKKYKVLQTFDLDGATHEAGGEVELTEEQAKPLIDAGKVEAVA